MTATDQDGLTVLDHRFPIRCDANIPEFNRLLHRWANRDTIIWAAARAAEHDAVVQERFIAAVREETRPMPALPALPPYPQLDEDTLAREAEPISAWAGVND